MRCIKMLRSGTWIWPLPQRLGSPRSVAVLSQYDIIDRQPLIKGTFCHRSDVVFIVPQWARRCVEGDRPMFLDAVPGMNQIYKRVGFHTIGETYCLSGKEWRHVFIASFILSRTYRRRLLDLNVRTRFQKQQHFTTVKSHKAHKRPPHSYWTKLLQVTWPHPIRHHLQKHSRTRATS